MSTELPYGRDFYLARHAETDDNKNKVVSTAQAMLTENGKAQAIKAQNILAQIPSVNRIVTSQMPRAIETGGILNALRNLPSSKYNEINERDYGEAKGMPDEKRREIKVKCDEIAGEESKDAQRVRTIGAIVENLKMHDGIPLFVTHGGNIKRVMEHVLGENVANSEYVTNCTIYEFIAPKGKGEGWKVNVLGLDSNKDIIRRPFGESKIGRFASPRNERSIGMEL